MTIEQRVAKLERWRWWGFWACLIFAIVLCGLLAFGFLDSNFADMYWDTWVSPVLGWLMVLVAVLAVVLVLAHGFWRYRLSVHVLGRRRKLLNDAMKARLDELGQAAKEPPTYGDPEGGAAPS